MSYPNITRERVFYSTGLSDPVFDSMLSGVNVPYRVLNVFTDLMVDDCVTGSKLMESDLVPIYILLPRNIVVNNSPSQHIDILHLKKLLMRYSKPKSRGSRCTGLSSKYATIGVHCNRSRSGLSNTRIFDDCVKSFEHVKKMLGRVQHYAAMYLPFGLLSTLNRIKESTKDKSNFIPNNNEQRDVWASLATSYNYVSPIHTDRDSFLSCLMVSHVPSHASLKKQQIVCDLDVAV